MKTLITVLVAVSVALNLALLVTLLAGRQNAPTPPAVTVAKSPAPARAAPAIDDQTWTGLRSDNLQTMVQRLREHGFPPEVVRAIMAAHLRDAYAAQMKALDPEADNRPFWKNFSIDPKVRSAQNKLHREQQKILRDLLGSDGDPQEQISALYQGRRFDSVPPEKVADVQRVLRDFEDARQEIYSNAMTSIGPEAQKRLTELEKEQRAALASVLTPQEFEEWQLRNSDTARSLRGQLTAFDPTEAEFRAIFKLQADFDEQYGRVFYTAPGPEESRRRGEAHRLMTEQIKAVLGPVRSTEYERANDHNYRQTSQLVQRLELPPETTNQVYEVQKAILDRSRELHRTTTAEAERTARLAELAKEAETKIAGLLGPRGFEAYKQYGGSWMQSLRPRTAPSGPVITPLRVGSGP